MRFGKKYSRMTPLEQLLGGRLGIHMNDDGGEGGGGGGEGGQSDADAVAVAAAESGPSWSYAEGVGGEGDAPEWFNGEKYKSVSDQAKGYSELAQKFGSFTGAPEAYEFALSDELKEKGVELDKENPLVAQFTEMAKEANMSQDMANKLVNMFVESEFAAGADSEEAEDARIAQEMKALGDNAETRVKNINSWANANFDAEMVAHIEEATSTAGGVKAVEALIAKTRNASLVNDDVKETSAADLEEIKKLQFEKDDNGNRRMATDPAFRKMVQGKLAEAFPGENRTQVG